jgi:hypothetical protein
MNNIIPFQESQYHKAAERKKTEDTLKYHMALSVLRRLRQEKELTAQEFETCQKILAEKCNYQGYCTGLEPTKRTV